MRDLYRVAPLVGHPSPVNSSTDTDTLPKSDINDTMCNHFILVVWKNLGGLTQEEDLLNHWLDKTQSKQWEGHLIWYSSIISVILINFQLFPAIPYINIQYQPVLALFINLQQFPVIPAIYSHLQPVLAISNNLQLYTAICNNSIHSQLFPANFSNFLKFHIQKFQPFKVISRHIPPILSRS